MGRFFGRPWGQFVLPTMAVLAIVGAAIYFISSQGSGSDQPLSKGPGAGQPSSQSPGSEPAAGSDDVRETRRRFPRAGFPLIGANYTHYEFVGCGLSETGVVANYHKRGVRHRVRSQLVRMRKSGVASVRTIIWHMTDPAKQRWGVVPSAGGKLGEPYRTNLIRYARDLKALGFVRLTVAFSPQWTNNPRKDIYDQSKFDENSAFIQDVRPIVKRYGPKQTRLDLLNEGAPSNYFPKPMLARVTNYLRRLWTRYVTAFGRSDVSVSTTPARKTIDQGHRLQNLINIFKSTGLGQPPWFDLHIGYTATEAENALRNSDAVLTQNGLTQPIVVGETAYNHRPIARVIKDLRKEMAHRVEEISPWYLRWTKKCNVDPPYSAGAYRRELVSRR